MKFLFCCCKFQAVHVLKRGGVWKEEEEYLLLVRVWSEWAQYYNILSNTMLVRVLANLHIGRLVDYWPTPTQGGWYRHVTGGRWNVISPSKLEGYNRGNIQLEGVTLR